VNFHNLFFLYFIPLISLPFIIYYFVKKKYSKHLITYIPFIEMASKKMFIPRKVKIFFVLLSRLLILFFLILLFSNPFYTKFKSKDKISYTAILIDNSLSMNLKYDKNTLLDKAKQIASSFVSISSDDSFISISPFSVNIDRTPVFFKDKITLINKINSIKSTFNNTDVSTSFYKTISYFNTIKNADKKIIIISDFSSNQSKELNLDIKQNDIKVICFDLFKDNINNISLINAKMQDNVYAGSNFIINAELYNASKEEVNSCVLNMHIDDKNTDTQIIKINSKSNKVVNLNSKINENKEYKGVISIGADNFLEDNYRYCVLLPKNKTKILLVDGDPSNNPYNSETYYISYALNPREDMKDCEERIVTFDEFKNVDLSNYDIVFLCNISTFDEEISAKLNMFLLSGKSLIVSLGNKTDVNSFNTHLFDIFSVKLKSFLKGEYDILPGSKNNFSNINLDKKYFYSAKCAKFFTLDKTNLLNVILEADSGNNLYPLLVEKKYKNNPLYGNVFLYLTSIDFLWNDLPIRPVYVELWQEIIKNELSADNSKFFDNNLVIGSDYLYPINDSLYNTAQIEYPNKIIKSMTLVNKNGSKCVFVSDLNLPGFYTIKWNSIRGAQSHIFAVNVDKDEIMFNKDIYDSFYLQFGNKFSITRYMIDSSKDEKLELQKIFYGKSLFNTFFYILLFLVLIELLLNQGILFKILKKFL
jgi:hypothetical protein